MDYGTITDVHVTNSTVRGFSTVGGLIGNLESYGDESTISNTSFQGVVAPYFGAVYSEYFGGLVGGVFASNGSNISFTNVSTNAEVYGVTDNGWAVGGMFGEFDSFDDSVVTLSNATSIGSVTGATATGGLIGAAYAQYLGGGTNPGIMEISNSHADASVTSTDTAGGLIGQAEGSSGGTIDVSTSYAAGNVEVTGGDLSGGLIGAVYGWDYSVDVSQSYATGNVTVCQNCGDAGGLIGYIDETMNINDAYATGDVSGTYELGGLIGGGAGDFTNVYATGSVTSDSGDYIGGLIGGYYYGELDGSFAVGAVTVQSGDPSYLGGLIGYTNGSESNTLFNNYYAPDTTGQPDCIGSGDVGQCTYQNTTATEPNYYFDPAHDPMTAWDFENIWIAHADTYPTFQFNDFGNSPVIRNCHQFQAIQDDTEGAYVLGSDLDCSDTVNWNEGDGFRPITDFVGTLDGAGHTITGLTINRFYKSGVGIFESLGGSASVTNLTLTDGVINGNEEVGAVAGWVNDESTVTIDNVHTNMTVLGQYDVGGLVGDATADEASVTITNVTTGGTVGLSEYESWGNSFGGIVGSGGTYYGTFNLSDSSSTVTIDLGNQADSVGGVAGELEFYDESTVTLDNLSASGDVSGTEDVGGLIGYLRSSVDDGGDPTIANLVDSSASGEVWGSYAIGGLIGEARAYDGSRVDIRGGSATGDVYGVEDGGGNVGGLIGETSGDDASVSVRQSFATGDVSAYLSWDVGGLIGEADDLTLVINTYAAGSVAGYSRIGGLIGNGDSIVSKSYASGDVYGNTDNGNQIAGLIGEASGMITDSFSTGAVDGPTSTRDYQVAGLIGEYSTNYTTLKNNYYDRETSGQPDCSLYWSQDDEYAANNESDKCRAVNGENSQPEYFLGNNINGPLSQWDFEGVWEQNAGALPTLRATGSFGAPSPPINLDVSGNKTNLELSWGAPENDGGSPLVGYIVQYRAHNNDNDWENIGFSDAGTPAMLVDQEYLDYYAYYDFRVIAITEMNISDPSDMITANLGVAHTVSNCEDLQNISNDLSGTYTLANDIDCSDTVNWNDGAGFTPIGIDDDSFTGTLDGQGHRITDLYINREDIDGNHAAGLFYGTDSATLANFSLVGGSITAGSGGGAGAIAVYADYTNAFNVSSDLDVTGLDSGYVGGLFGELWSGDYENHSGSTLLHAFSTGHVTGSSTVGGLIGYSGATSIYDSYYNGLVTSSNEYAGGLVGYADNIDLVSSYAAGGVYAGTYYAGGLFGTLNGSSHLDNAFAANTVESNDTDYNGALIGYVFWEDSMTFNNNHYDSGLSGLTNCVGGWDDPEGCTAQNADNNDTAYFMANSTNDPFGQWDWEGTWRTTDSYPVLQGFNFTPDEPVLAAGSATSSRINLSWDDQAGVDQYTLQYKLSSEGDEYWTNYTHLNSPDANSVTINGLTHNTSYDFRILASNSGDDSGWSNVVTKSTTSQVYNITNCDQLQDINGDTSGDYKLMNGINCSATENWNGGAGFWPIGYMNWGNAFSGSLDGNGWQIGNLTIDRTSENDDSSGLFYHTEGALIKDLTFVDGSIQSRYSAGSVVAFANNSFIENVHSSVDVTTVENGEVCTGGLVGCYYAGDYANGHIINSSTSGEINGTWDVGGIVGYAYKMVLSHTYSTSYLSGQAFVGGLGGAINDSFVSDVYTRGGVYADNEHGYVGGLFGYAGSTLIQRAYSSDQVFGDMYVGGLIGSSANTQIQNSFSEAAVSGNDADHTGAVVGYDDVGTVMINVYQDQGRTEQEHCIGTPQSDNSCAAFNTDGSDEFHYYGSTSLAPLDQWDFDGVWVMHDDDLPTLAGVPYLEGDGIRAQTTTTSITVSWDGTSGNGSPITGYELFYKKSGTSTWIPVTINPALATSATVTGLTPSTQYDFSWRAINAYGKSSRILFFTWTKDAAAPAAKSTVVVTSSKKASQSAAPATSTDDIYLDDFTEYAIGTGKQLDLKVGQVVHFTIERDGVKEPHTATVKEVGADYVILTVASTPFDVRVTLGEVKTIRIDGQAAIQVKLASVNNGIASLVFSKPYAAPAADITAAAPTANRDYSELFGVICLLISAYLIIEALRPRKQPGHIAAAH